MSEPKSKRAKQALIALIGFGLIVSSAAAVTMLPSPKPEDEQVFEAPPAPPVTVRTASPGAYQAQIRVNTIALPRYDLTVRSAVSGQVVELSPATLPGQRVAEGDMLARLNDTALRAQLAEARNRLASARSALALAEREGEQAVAAWDRSGEVGLPPDLVARRPQIEAARTEEAAAQAVVADARRQLNDAVITAPFSGVIVERMAMPGAHLAIGDPLVQLQHDDTLDIAVQLSQSEAALLSDEAGTMTAALVEQPGGQIWPAEVRMLSGVMNATTRQATLYLERRQSAERLAAGAVVEAVVSGRSVEGLYRIPERAFTRDGVIWVVRADDRLDRIPAELIFVSDSHVHLRLPPEETGALRVAVNPVSSFTRGNRVAPIEEG